MRSPGEPLSPRNEHVDDVKTLPLIISYGSLPGVTWTDDIHPIFIRNDCGHCHTRGKEVVAEGFKELALGIVDSENKDNAYYSYHELVYAEGTPQIQEGETLRDGQCCWPRDVPAEKQRRIWIGHAERSALVRKLEHDYYDRDNPPRFFEEALKLKWGLPMPMYKKGDKGHEDHGAHADDQRIFDIRPFYEQVLFNLSLWLGGGKGELRQWPQRIPDKDRLLLRYWIDNSIQLTEEGTGIKVRVTDARGKPLREVNVKLTGNYNSPERREVVDEVFLKTDRTGELSIAFPQSSVVTLNWYATAYKEGYKSEEMPLVIRPREINEVELVLR
jgi:hypothetical protein